MKTPLFSERFGFTPIQQIQLSGMTESLRNSLWNVVFLTLFDGMIYTDSRKPFLKRVFTYYWMYYFKRPVDTIHTSHSINIDTLRKYFFAAEWHATYDFIEFSILVNDKFYGNESFTSRINNVLEDENSGYRCIEGVISPITSNEEIHEIDIALNCPNTGVRKHLENSLNLMSSKENPDYCNSIKESISAVESLCMSTTGNTKSTLGQLLDHIEKDGKIHPALKKAFSNLYGWTSNEGGIRHAMLDEPNLTLTDARFMLVACSAFVNYIIDKTK